MRTRLAKLSVAILGLAALAACSKQIGDPCLTSADCSPNGDRSCDTSQPGGYCTVDGCDQQSCPGSAVCIRFFPGTFLDRPCDPATEDAQGGSDDCPAEDLCLPAGLCAPRASERRFCGGACGSDDDCRSGYECRVAGTRGSIALSTSSNGSPIRFCAPR